jgi:hypothetical protein
VAGSIGKGSSKKNKEAGMNFIERSGKRWSYFLGALAIMLGLGAAAQGQFVPGSGKTSLETGVRASSPTSALAPGTIQISVQCGNPTARLKTIADGLKLLGGLRPAALLISGTCHEDVSIEGLDSIILQGNPTATIDGGSDPNTNAVAIVTSQDIALNNLTITGGAGLVCIGLSSCALTQVTIQNSLGDGATVNGGSHLEFLDCIIQNNASAGLNVGAGSASVIGGRITGNGSDGVLMRLGGTFAAAPADVNDNATIQNNAGNGIRASLHNTLNLNSAVITGNAVDGVTLQLGSAMSMIATSITNNGGHQVRIGDLSVARFSGFQSNTISGLNFPDVVCDPRFSATRQLAANAVGATTNCPAELPPTP